MSNIGETQCQKYKKINENLERCQNIALDNVYNYCSDCWQTVKCEESECNEKKSSNKYCKGHDYLRIRDKINLYGVAYDFELFEFLRLKTKSSDTSDSSDESENNELEDSGIDPIKYKIRTLNIVLGATDYDDE